MTNKNNIKNASGIQRKNAFERNEAELRYSAVFDQSPDGILIIDAEGKIIDFNKAAHTDLGYTREEFSKFSISDIDPVQSPDEIRVNIQRAMSEKMTEFEVVHRTKSGQLRNVLVITQAIVLSGRTVLHSIWRDITEQKAKDKKIKYLASIIEHLPDAVSSMDTEGRIVSWNEGAEKILGYKADEIIGSPMQSIIPEEKAREEIEHCIGILNTEGVFTGHETVRVAKDGREVPVEISGLALRDGQKITGYASIMRDINERKRSEEKLIRRERQLSESQKAARIGSWSWDIVNNTLEWSDETYKRFEKAPDTFTPTTEYFMDRIHPADREAVQRALQDSLKNDASYHIQSKITNDSGMEWVMEAFGIVERDINGAPLRFAGTAQDITERKKIEEALKESETQFMELFKNGADAIFIADMESGIIVEANQAASRLMLLPHDKIVGLHHSRLHPPRTDKYSKEIFEEHKNEAGRSIPTHPAEHKVIRSDGVEVPIEVLAAMVTIKGRKCLMGTFRDITERKKTEDKIRRSEEFIRNILNTVDEGFIVLDRDFRILTANKAYCSQVGEPCDSVIGRHCYEISHKTLRPCFEEGEECAVRHVFETGKPHTAFHKHQDSKGSILYVETKAFPIMDSTGAVTSVIETVNNITEKHLLEEEQLKTQKLEAIGTLAGGIAHDFNNLLQGVFGYISMAKLTLDQKDLSLTMLEQAEKALHMSVNLTTQLLTFSKGGNPLKKKIPLQSVIENSVRFALSGSNVDHRIKFDEDLWAIEADEGQIGQVVQNLVLNAEQAMPMGGTITITARNISSSQKEIPPILRKANYVEISIKDSGIGIPQQYLPKIFDPYFTTKDKGSGLGLATSYSIIKNHGGLIDVKSKLGVGTTFFVYLPAVEALETIAVTAPKDFQALRKARILLMDDEDIVRNIAGVMIRSLGHEVELAENGVEAIGKYRESMRSGRPFDIVIMDLTVRGGMGGEEAIRGLLEIDPDIKAIVSSGYADSSAMSEFTTIGFRSCLTKPYDIDSLNAVLNGLLD